MAKYSWPQPILRHMKEQRWTLNRAADEIGIPRTHFINACYGRTSPSPDLRARITELLGVPLVMLFSAEQLERTYTGGQR